MNKKFKKQDPCFSREAKKYEFPIPSREYILQVLEEYARPITFKRLCKELELDKKDELRALDFRLRAMLRDGQMMQDRRERYCLLSKIELRKGTVVGHSDGYGFVVLDAGGDDLFLSAQQMRQVFPGDRVLVRELGKDRRGRREAVIHEVIERCTKEIVGRFFLEHGIGCVEPENKRISRDIYIPATEQGGAEHGQIVTALITVQPNHKVAPVGKIIEVLGDHMAPGMEIDIAIRAHELPHSWSQDIVDETKQFEPEISDKVIKKRTDLRKLHFVTIDGEDARDFDDAVCCEPQNKGGWQLYVAIADVSHYVKENTALDEEALSRGNSVYFPERVIPMLPEILSNDLCSLRPDVDRLSMVCEMTITPKGKLSRYRFYDAIICSQARLTYTAVAKMLVDEDAEVQEKHREAYPHLQELYELYHVLHKTRETRGAIDFDTTETRIIFGEDKKISDIVPVMRNDAHRLIEECMLMANVCAASFLQTHKIPGLFRIHAPPSDDKIIGLREFLGELGLQLKGGKKPKTKDYSYLLKEIKGRKDAHLIQTVLLRSLSQAIYSAENIGHFGLAYDSYAHFTSPIRRYPDLLLHRAIRHILNHREVIAFTYDVNTIDKMGMHCSQTERRADEATRDAIDWLKCEYMLDKVGNVFDGIITSVTNFGLFVELNDIYVEGLIHITALRDDYYHHDPVRHRLRGERTGTAYRLGDKIRIQVVRVDLDDRHIDFALE